MEGDEVEYSSPEWDLVAIRALFNPVAADGVTLTAQFHVEGTDYWIRVDDGHLTTQLGEQSNPNLVIRTARETLYVLSEPASTASAIDRGDLEFRGDGTMRDVLSRVLSG
jgi:alkyl sulfatase BDS1-like metallo-beta-lactamase superfamily hydrolase